MNTVLLLFIIYCATALAVPASEWDNIEDENKETIEEENRKTAEDDSSVLDVKEQDHTIIPSDYEVRAEGNQICIYRLRPLNTDKKYGCVARNKVCRAVIGAFKFKCDSDEELFNGRCYKKCSILANSHFPRRRDTHTCQRNGCRKKDQDYDAGLCYRKCKKGYHGRGPVCWGSCHYFCGKEYADWGLICMTWSKSCKKRRYSRGAGGLPYQLWTKGTGCNGFNVDNKGKCPKIDFSSKLPRSIRCY